MKKFLKIGALFFLNILFALMTVPVASAAGGATSLNAQFTKWTSKAEVIHIFVHQDAGRPGQPPAVVSEGKKLLFGFEQAGDSIAALNEAYYDNPGHDITLSVDGGPAFSVLSGYQAPFIAATRSGPAWSWDHDGDGPGDRDGNGIGDWSGPVMFFRYQYPAVSVGTHTFLFTMYYDDGTSVSDTITVEVVSG